MSKTIHAERPKPQKPRGQHPFRRLTDVQVRSKKTPGRYADGDGLYLVVDDSGAKRWLLRTVAKGKRRDIGLGSTRQVTLKEAREEAAKLRRIARDGGDPLASRRRDTTAVPTFAEAAAKVHALHAATFRNEKHKAQWLASVKADVFPVFGNNGVDTVTSDDVLKALTPIWTVKPETARRLRQRIRTVFDWAKASGFRGGDNPVDGVTRVLPKPRQVVKHHAALPYADVPALLGAVRAAEANTATKLAFEFMVLTAARTGEVIGARWEEIDREKKMWTVPAARIKAGREHRVPLSDRCMEILKAAESIRGDGPFVFPGRVIAGRGRPLSNMAFLMLLRRLEREDITAHGFRSSFRDWAEEQTNTPRSVVEAALAHVVKDKTEAAYFRSDLFDRRRELMETWAAFTTGQAGQE